ncbi:MAG: CU044_2847 family protein [Candidatus Aminicenantes bacterium]|nr:CU044_2847 family protein [Candidatus Aminicenantes bacterium]
MKRFIEFPSGSKESILIELDVPEEEGGVVEVSRNGAIPKATKSFESVMEAVTPIADCLIERLTNLRRQPKDIEVEFGIKMNIDAKVVIASSSLEANFKVTLKWKQE